MRITIEIEGTEVSIKTRQSGDSATDDASGSQSEGGSTASSGSTGTRGATDAGAAPHNSAQAQDTSLPHSSGSGSETSPAGANDIPGGGAPTVPHEASASSETGDVQ